MKLLELHILQSFPVSCLNRDDMGTPKTAMFGGVKRARISSQCLKRSQRMLFKELLPDFCKGERTKLLMSAFHNLITSRPDCDSIPAELPAILASAWCNTDSDKKSKDGMPKATTLTYLSPAEMTAMVDAALQILSSSPNAKEKNITSAALKAVKGAMAKDAADIALYGRMVASEASLTTEGAAMFSHALSTHKSEPELDFYSAIDDLQPEDESGAGMTGILEFSSACYYRYVAVNIDLLKSHLEGGAQEHVNEILEAFVRSVLLAVPSARKNSMNAATVPSYVMGIVRDGHPIQFVNAFESPVKTSKGYTEASINALKAEFEKMQNIWGLKVDAQAELPDTDLQSFVSVLMSALT